MKIQSRKSAALIVGVLTALSVAGASATDQAELLQAAFYEQGGALRLTDTRFQQADDHYLMDRARYSVIAPERLGEIQYRFDALQLGIEPGALRWQSSSPVSLAEGTARLVVDGREVEGGTDPGRPEQGLVYDNAYGTGVHLGLLAKNLVFRKIVRVDDLAALGSIPESATALEVPFAIHTEARVRNAPDGRIEIGDGRSMIVVQPAYAWDSEGHRVSIPLLLQREGDHTTITKRIPVTWLEQATYPVYADFDVTFNGETVFDATNVSESSITALDASHVFIAYRDNSAGGAGTGIVGTISAGSITFGTPVTFNVNAAAPAVTTLDSTHALIAYREWSNGNIGTAVVATISGGDTITYGTPVTFNPASTGDLDVDALDSSTAVIAYSDNGNSNFGTSIVATISGDVISYGSETTFQTAAVASLDVAALDATRVLIAFQDTGNSGFGTGIIGTVSGLTISFGAEAVFASANMNTIRAERLGNSRALIAYRDVSTPDFGRAIVANIAGSVITYGAEAVFSTDRVEYISLMALDATHAVLAYEVSYFGVAHGVTVYNGDSIALGEPVVFNQGASSLTNTPFISGTELDSDSVAIAYTDSDNSNFGTVTLGEMGPSAVTLIGFETGDAAEIDTLSAGGTVSPPSRPGSGTYSLHENGTSTLVAGLLPPLDKIGFRFSFLKPANPGALQTLIQFRNGATNLWKLQLQPNGTLITFPDEALGMVPDPSTIALADNTWYTIRLVYDAAASGVVRVWIDDSLEIDMTHGVGGSPIDTIDVIGPAATYSYDDFRIGDTTHEPVKGQIIQRRVNEDGVLVEFDTPNPLPTRWDNVNEILYNDTDFNQHAATSVATDLYGLLNFTLGNINAVKAMWRMRRSGGSTGGTHDYAWRVNGITETAPFPGITTTYSWHEKVWGAPPHVQGAWTVPLFDAMQLGASHNGTGGQDTFISWTAAMVDYLYAGTPLYRSVGVSAADLNTSSRTVEITGTTATFSGPMPDNVGVGDVLQYQVAATFYVAFIHGRTSDTVYTVASSTGGTPQAAAAGTAVNVYRAYTSLANWESQTENTSLDNSVENFDTSTNLVSGNTIMNVACYGDGVDTTMVIVDGWTTGPDNYIKIYTPVSSKEVGGSQRHSGVWDPSKYRIESGVAPIRIGAASAGAGHVWIDGLQVFLTSVTGNGNSGILVNQTAQADHRISNNIIRGVTNSSFWNVGIYTYAAGTSSTIRIWNNVVYDFDGTNSGVCLDFGSDADITAYAYNNTANNCFYGYRETGSNIILKNNISYGNSDNYAGTFDASSTNNLSGPGADASMPATNARDGVTVTYVNAAGDDYHLAPGDTGAQDFGANLTSDPNLGFFYDIDLGGRQTPWDIGADDVLATTAVELVSFVATGINGAVELRWATGSEIDNLGFHLYRAEVEEGPYERITSSPIPGLGSSPEGASYSYRDPGLTNGVTYFYKLEDIEATGKTELHGPVMATPQPGVDVEEESPSALVTYGDPSLSSLKVLEHGRGGVVLELTTGGFYAEPQEDGTVVLTVPDFAELSSPGSPSIPVRRTWVEAIAGRKVELVSVVTREVEAFAGLRPSGAALAELVADRDGTVHLRQKVRASRRLHTAAPSQELYPSEAARLVTVGFQGDVKKALVELAPLRWDDALGQLLLARHLEVTLSFQGREPAEKSTNGVQGRRYRRRRSQDARHVLVRLATTEPGLYGIPFEVVSGERGPGVDASRLRLSRQGAPVAFHLEPSSTRFGPGSILFFVSEGAAANPYGREALYELEAGQPAERMMELDVTPSGEAASFYWKTLKREENHFYQAALVDAPDLWLWDLLFAPVVKHYPFAIDALAPATESSRLSLWLQGVSDAHADPDHHVRVSVNGSFFEDVTWDGKAARHVDVELPPGILREGENLLELENVGDTEAPYSMVMLDRFEVSYPRSAVADDGELEGRFSISGMAQVSGLASGAHVLDVTSEQPRWLTGSELGTDGVLRFRAESTHRYLVVSPAAVLRPEVRQAWSSTLKSGHNRADYLVIGPRAFLDTAQPLLELRQRQGLEVQAIAIQDVFAEFGFGEATPEALRDFIAYAYHSWEGPPRYVVLLGDATYDYKDYLKTGVSNQVPPLMVRTSYLWTTSDPAYASVNGEDLLPDLAIGRLPAATVDEARTMVAKIVAYETEDRGLDGRTVLVADNPDHAGDFQADAEALASGILAGRDLRKIYLSELGAETARARILTAFDQGASLLSYLGHGGIHLWASEDLLNISQVDALSPQSQQPLVLTMNCLNGYYHFPYFNSLSEELLKAEDRGAIAAFSPSGLSLNAPAELYHQALLRELIQGGHERLGDAVLAAQEAYASSGAFPELLSIYHLLGDPALSLE